MSAAGDLFCIQELSDDGHPSRRRLARGVEAALSPEVCNRLDRDKTTLLDEQPARSIEARIRPESSRGLRHPSTEILSEIPTGILRYPITGMYGGFSIEPMRGCLFVGSSSRMEADSGESHVVTTSGFLLVEESE